MGVGLGAGAGVGVGARIGLISNTNVKDVSMVVRGRSMVMICPDFWPSMVYAMK